MLDFARTKLGQIFLHDISSIAKSLAIIAKELQEQNKSK